MAMKGMSVFSHAGEDYTINDPNIAPEFDTTEEYQVGEYVNFRGDLYRLTEGHEANVTWANTYKVKVELSNELTRFRKAVNENPFTFAISSTNSKRLVSVDLPAPDKIRITQTDPAYSFYILTIDKAIKKVAELPDSWTNDIIYEKTPEVAYIRVIMKKNNDTVFYTNTDGVDSLLVQQIKALPYESDTIVLDHLEFEQGSFDSRGKIPGNARIRTSDIIFAAKGSRIDCPSGYKYEIEYFNKYAERISTTEWITNNTEIQQDSYILIVICRSDNNEIGIGEAENFSFTIIQDRRSDVELLAISLPLIGDAMALRFSPSGETMLIDLGTANDYTLVKNKLKAFGIKKIDYLMVSHYHTDHISTTGLSSLISDFDMSGCTALLPPTIPDSYVGNQWTTGAEVRTMQSNIKQILTNAGIPYKDSYYPQGRLNMHFGKVPFVLYNTDQTQEFEDNYGYNDLSVVALMKNRKVSVLFTGDMMTESAPSIIEAISQTVNIVKFGHHGLDNKANTPIAFYQALSPEVLFSSSPSNHETYATNYANSGAIRLANYNGIPNIMTGYSGDLLFHISADGFSVNGKNHRLTTLTSEEFFEYVL